ncbi:Transcription initiation factor TFIID, subunit TAF7 [Ceraceosorus bombacis]|uniref:Transcription initiation factor TFIID, subunit TAF7 n=1 Tax=Ceraceosorus bombacis TaxID=401625 RepID=A0A0P1BRP5_9BASI|nr:Transcription initiation factor TFIID, subunit TAF7 [Ceraceosorus bombacis]
MEVDNEAPVAGPSLAVPSAAAVPTSMSALPPAPAPATAARSKGTNNGGAGAASLLGGGLARRLKLNLKSTIGSAGGSTSGTGPKNEAYMQGYTRELDDSDDDDEGVAKAVTKDGPEAQDGKGSGVAFEEQLILRLAAGSPELETLRGWVKNRAVGTDKANVELKFKDSRRATFKIGNTTLPAKLVDLPTILETHKTLDGRQLFKVADISQMLLVGGDGDRREEEEDVNDRKGGGADAYVWDSGITPPMRYARKRRFRKRTNKRVIETVEKEVERLLADDKRAEKLEYEMIDVADLSDGGGDEEEVQGGAGEGASMVGDEDGERDEEDGEDDGGEGGEDRDGSVAPTEGEGREEYIDEEEGEGEGMVDMALAAELEAVMRGEASDSESGSDEGSASVTTSNTRGGRGRSVSARATSEEGDGDLWGDEDEEDESGGEDDEEAREGDDQDGPDLDDDDDVDAEESERRVRESQVEAAVKEMELLVKRKTNEANAATNVVIKNRQLDALKRLTTERDLKQAQLQEIRSERRARAQPNPRRTSTAWTCSKKRRRRIMETS